MNDNTEKRPPKFPDAIIKRVNAKGTELGITSFPAALFYVDLGLTGDEKLVTIALFDHYRKQGDRPWCAQDRVASMAGISRKKAGNAIRALETKGLIERTPHGRGHAHDLSPLLKMMETAPLKRMPDGRDEEKWEKDQEIARLKEENALLKAQKAPFAGAQVVLPPAQGEECSPFGEPVVGVDEHYPDDDDGDTQDDAPVVSARLDSEEAIDSALKEFEPKGEGRSITIDERLDEFDWSEGAKKTELDAAGEDAFLAELAELHGAAPLLS